MNKLKYFRVKKITSKRKEIIYQVEAADSFLQMVFGMWYVYIKENKTLDEAISQIKCLSEDKIEEEKVVFKHTIK